MKIIGENILIKAKKTYHILILEIKKKINVVMIGF